MGYGLVDTGYSKKNQALQGMSQTAQSETQRNIANDNIKQAEKGQKKANAGAGASAGAAIGANMASSMGLGAASIGASALATGGIGLAAGLLFSELF